LDESASKPEASQHAKIKINKLLLKENEGRGEYYACGRWSFCHKKASNQKCNDYVGPHVSKRETNICMPV
jgi:hypothetical protein